MDGVRHDYTYASGQLLRESFTQGGTAYTLDFLYDQSSRPYMLYLTTTTGSTTVSAPYYYILNLQGDVIHLVNTSGAAVASYTYDPYGSPLTATGSLATVNPLRYRGYYYDTETGFYYLQSRYYDPALGRFINADSYASTGQGFLGYNMFAYCNNSPVSHNDPNGKMMVCYVDAFPGGGRSAPADSGDDDLLIVAAEHHKRGTTNRSNRGKHEKGQARKNRDAGAEKADERRRRYRQGLSYEGAHFVGPIPKDAPLMVGPKPQESVYNFSTEPENGFWDYCWEGVKIVGCGFAIICLYADDLSGFGVADNMYADYLSEIVSQSWAFLGG